MKLNISILLVLLSLSVLSVRADSEFKVEKLSNEGKEAYTKLFSAHQFSIGLVGWGAHQSDSEKALRVLLTEKKAKEALISLIHNASPEGSLYALFGLRMNNLKAFNQELKYYKSKPEPPERLRNPDKKVSPQSVLKSFDILKAGQVRVLSGCIATNAQLKVVITSIETGIYDETFRANKTGVEYIITNSESDSKKN